MELIESDDENCPICNHGLGEHTLIEAGEIMRTGDPSLPFDAGDWTEIHQCQCGQIVKFYASNY